MNRWQNIDNELNKYLTKYNSLNKDLQDELQIVFDSIKVDFNDINKPIGINDTKRLERAYNKAKNSKILTSYSLYKANKILNKKNISYYEMIGLLIEFAYLRQEKDLDEQEILKNITQIAQEDALKEINGKKKSNMWLFALGLLALPNKLTGYVWGTYKEGTLNYNVEQIQKQIMINLQQNKKLDVDDVEFQNLIKSQNNRYLYKKKADKEDKWRGAFDTEVSYLVNNIVLRSYVDNGIDRVKFDAVMDNRTSQLCAGLNGTIFYTNKYNTYYRQNLEELRDTKYVTFGLESGINLPPLHPNCRSSITAIRD